MAAKSNYFGVGGGTEEFKVFLEEEEIFEVHDSSVIEGGQNEDLLTLLPVFFVIFTII